MFRFHVFIVEPEAARSGYMNGFLMNPFGRGLFRTLVALFA